jgi:prepilin-type N-terminal cleavage/methylation domain-containing protein/prepilin-type processing-associated H-X9-DG protein
MIDFTCGFSRGARMSIKSVKRGFTLVELLVVIGIIALLISMLLPALNRAREQANLVACSANLRGIGQSIQEYAAENRGFMPYGYASMKGGATNLNGDIDYLNVCSCWQWPDSLSRLTNNKAPGDGGTPTYAGYSATNEGNLAIDFLGIFHDYDTSGLGYLPRVSDYQGNPAVLIDVNMFDPRASKAGQATDPGPGSAKIGGGYMSIRQMGSIRRPTDTMMVWCGPQDLSNGISNQPFGVQYGPLAEQLDCSMIESGGNNYGMYYPTPVDGTSYNAYMNPVSEGNLVGHFGYLPVSGVTNKNAQNGGVTMFTVTYLNKDITNPSDNYASFNNMRFRHMNNTTLNALFIDGHVESRKLLQVLAKDVSIQTSTSWGTAPGQGE